MGTTTMGIKDKTRAATPIPLTFGILLVMVSSLAFGGTSAPNSTAKVASPRRVPIQHVYWHLLRYQIHLDKRATTLAQQGRTEDAATLRQHLQKELQFTDTEIAIFREAGLQLEKDLADIQEKAMPIIYEDRQWLTLNGRSAGPPPGHSQVHELQKEHEAAIVDAVARLNQRLGPTAAAQLQARVERDWAPRVPVHKFATPLTHNAATDSKSTAPFHLEAQP